MYDTHSDARIMRFHSEHICDVDHSIMRSGMSVLEWFGTHRMSHPPDRLIVDRKEIAK